MVNNAYCDESVVYNGIIIYSGLEESSWRFLK
jgi:hypothetical protein